MISYSDKACSVVGFHGDVILTRAIVAESATCVSSELCVTSINVLNIGQFHFFVKPSLSFINFVVPRLFSFGLSVLSSLETTVAKLPFNVFVAIAIRYKP